MPEYMKGEHEWVRPMRKLHTPAKGLKSVLNQVSPDAPASFLLRHITPSTPEARRTLLTARDQSNKDARLLQELKITHYRDYQKFTYEDYSPRRYNAAVVDMSTLPMKKREDVKRDVSDGIRAKLPFYREYAAAAKDGKFPMRQGMFMYKAGLKVVGRIDATQLEVLRSQSNTRLKNSSSCERSPINETRATHLNLSAFLNRRASGFNTKAMRAVLTPKSSKRDGKNRAKSVAGDGGVGRDIEKFEERRKTEVETLPTTKKVLWEAWRNAGNRLEE